MKRAVAKKRTKPLFPKETHVEQALLVILEYLEADTMYYSHKVEEVKRQLRSKVKL